MPNTEYKKTFTVQWQSDTSQIVKSIEEINSNIEKLNGKEIDLKVGQSLTAIKNVINQLNNTEVNINFNKNIGQQLDTLSQIAKKMNEISVASKDITGSSSNSFTSAISEQAKAVQQFGTTSSSIFKDMQKEIINTNRLLSQSATAINDAEGNLLSDSNTDVKRTSFGIQRTINNYDADLNPVSEVVTNKRNVFIQTQLDTAKLNLEQAVKGADEFITVLNNSLAQFGNIKNSHFKVSDGTVTTIIEDLDSKVKLTTQWLQDSDNVFKPISESKSGLLNRVDEKAVQSISTIFDSAKYHLDNVSAINTNALEFSQLFDKVTKDAGMVGSFSTRKSNQIVTTSLKNTAEEYVDIVDWAVNANNIWVPINERFRSLHPEALSKSVPSEKWTQESLNLSGAIENYVELRTALENTFSNLDGFEISKLKQVGNNRYTGIITNIAEGTNETLELVRDVDGLWHTFSKRITEYTEKPITRNKPSEKWTADILGMTTDVGNDIESVRATLDKTFSGANIKLTGIRTKGDGYIATMQDLNNNVESQIELIKNSNNQWQIFDVRQKVFQDTVKELENSTFNIENFGLKGSKATAREAMQTILGNVNNLQGYKIESISTNDSQNEISIALKDQQAKISSTIKLAKDLQGTWTYVGESIKTATTQTANMDYAAIGLSATLKGAMTIFATMFTSYRILAYIREGINTVKELDSTLVEMQQVANESSIAVEKFAKSTFDMANRVGSTAKDLQKSAVDYMRLGYTLQESASLVETTTKYSNVSGSDMSQATTNLISGIKAFRENFGGDEIVTAQRVADIYTKIGNNYAISASEIGDALSRSAAALTAANNDIYESVGLITAGNIIQQDANAVGNAMKVLSLRIRGASTDLSEMGEDTEGVVKSTSKLRKDILAMTGVDIQIDKDTYKSTAQIIMELHDVWDELSDIDQAALLEKIAGKTRASVVSGLIQNADVLKSVIEDARDSIGEVNAVNEDYLNGMEAHFNKVANSAQQFWQSMIDRGTVNGVLDVTNSIIRGFSGLVDYLGGVGIVAVIGFTRSFVTSMQTVQMQAIAAGKSITIWNAGLISFANFITSKSFSATLLRIGALVLITKTISDAIGKVQTIGKVSYESALDTFTKSQTKIEELRNSLGSVNTEIQNNEDRLRELLQLPVKSYVEQTEIDKLKTVTSELRTQKELLEGEMSAETKLAQENAKNVITGTAFQNGATVAENSGEFDAFNNAFASRLVKDGVKWVSGNITSATAEEVLDHYFNIMDNSSIRSGSFYTSDVYSKAYTAATQVFEEIDDSLSLLLNNYNELTEEQKALVDKLKKQRQKLLYYADPQSFTNSIVSSYISNLKTNNPSITDSQAEVISKQLKSEADKLVRSAIYTNFDTYMLNLNMTLDNTYSNMTSESIEQIEALDKFLKSTDLTIKEKIEVLNNIDSLIAGSYNPSFSNEDVENLRNSLSTGVVDLVKNYINGVINDLNNSPQTTITKEELQGMVGEDKPTTIYGKREVTLDASNYNQASQMLSLLASEYGWTNESLTVKNGKYVASGVGTHTQTPTTKKDAVDNIYQVLQDLGVDSDIEVGIAKRIIDKALKEVEEGSLTYNNVAETIRTRLQETFDVLDSDKGADFSSFADGLSTFDTDIAKIKEIVDRTEENGRLSRNDFISLFKDYPQYIQYLVAENGQIKLNEKAIEDYEKIKEKSLKNSLLQSMLDDIVNAAETGDVSKITNFISNTANDLEELEFVQFEAIANGLKSLYEQGLLDESQYKDALNAYQDYYSKIIKITNKVGDTENEVTEKAVSNYTNVKSALDSVISAYSTLQETIKSYNENGYITVQQFESLVDGYAGYLQYLQDENGNITLNNEALNKLVLTRMNAFEIEKMQNDVAEVSNLSTKEEANNYLLLSTAINNNTQSLVDNLKVKLKTALNDKVKKGIISESDALTVYNQKVKEWDSINNIRKYVNVADSFKEIAENTKDVADSTKDAAEATDDYITASVEAAKRRNERLQGELSYYSQISSNFSETVSAYEKLTEARDSYNENGYITISQFDDLITNYSDYLGLLVDEDGQLRVNKQQLEEILEVRIRNALEQEKLNDIEKITQLNNADAVKIYVKLTEAANSYAKSIGNVADALLEEALAAKQATGIMDNEQANIIRKNLQEKWSNQEKLVGQLASKVNVNLDTNIGSSSSNNSNEVKLYGGTSGFVSFGKTSGINGYNIKEKDNWSYKNSNVFDNFFEEIDGKMAISLNDAFKERLKESDFLENAVNIATESVDSIFAGVSDVIDKILIGEKSNLSVNLRDVSSVFDTAKNDIRKNLTEFAKGALGDYWKTTTTGEGFVDLFSDDIGSFIFDEINGKNGKISSNTIQTAYNDIVRSVTDNMTMLTKHSVTSDNQNLQQEIGYAFDAFGAMVELGDFLKDSLPDDLKNRTNLLNNINLTTEDKADLRRYVYAKDMGDTEKAAQYYSELSNTGKYYLQEMDNYGVELYNHILNHSEGIGKQLANTAKRVGKEIEGSLLDNTEFFEKYKELLVEEIEYYGEYFSKRASLRKETDDDLSHLQNILDDSKPDYYVRQNELLGASNQNLVQKIVEARHEMNWLNEKYGDNAIVSEEVQKRNRELADTIEDCTEALYKNAKQIEENNLDMIDTAEEYAESLKSAYESLLDQSLDSIEKDNEAQQKLIENRKTALQDLQDLYENKWNLEDEDAQRQEKIAERNEKVQERNKILAAASSGDLESISKLESIDKEIADIDNDIQQDTIESYRNAIKDGISDAIDKLDEQSQALDDILEKQSEEVELLKENSAEYIEERLKANGVNATFNIGGKIYTTKDLLALSDNSVLSAAREKNAENTQRKVATVTDMNGNIIDEALNYEKNKQLTNSQIGEIKEMQESEIEKLTPQLLNEIGKNYLTLGSDINTLKDSVGDYIKIVQDDRANMMKTIETKLPKITNNMVIDTVVRVEGNADEGTIAALTGASSQIIDTLKLAGNYSYNTQYS